MVKCRGMINLARRVKSRNTDAACPKKRPRSDQVSYLDTRWDFGASDAFRRLLRCRRIQPEFRPKNSVIRTYTWGAWCTLVYKKKYFYVLYRIPPKFSKKRSKNCFKNNLKSSSSRTKFYGLSSAFKWHSTTNHYTTINIWGGQYIQGYILPWSMLLRMLTKLQIDFRLRVKALSHFMSIVILNQSHPCFLPPTMMNLTLWTPIMLPIRCTTTKTCLFWHCFKYGTC